MPGWLAATWSSSAVPADGVLHAGCGHQHGEEKAECVGDDASLPADDLLAGVDALAGGGDVGGGLDALGVDHAGRRIGVPAFLLS